MKIFVIAIVMWWANPLEKPIDDSVEIHTYQGKPLYFHTLEECFNWVRADAESIKAFGHEYYPTANAVKTIYCVEKQERET